MSTIDERRQVGNIMINMYLRNKNYKSIGRLIESGFISKGDAVPYVKLVTRNNSGVSVADIRTILESVGAEHIPGSLAKRPVVKEWILSTQISKLYSSLVMQNKWSRLAKLPKYTMNPLLRKHVQFTLEGVFCKPNMVSRCVGSLAFKKRARFLLKMGATMNNVEGWHGTILQVIVMYRLEKFIDDRAFQKAFDVMVSLGADPKKFVEFKDGSKERRGTLLHYYCYQAFKVPFGDHVYSVAPFLENRGVSLNAVDSSGMTALHYVAKGYSHIFDDPTRTVLLDVLIKSGALYNIPNRNGKTVRDLVPEHSYMFIMSDLHRRTRSGTKKRKRS